MSLRTTDLEEANFLQGEDQFIFFQNSSRRVKRVRRSNMFASPGVSDDLSDIVLSGANELLSYTLTGDPVFQDYTGFVGQKQQFLEQASGFLDQRRQMLDIATGLLNDTGNQIRQQVVALNQALTGASGVLSSSINTVYIVATGASGTIAARIDEFNSQFTGATGSLGSSITNFTLTFANATGTLATDISTLNSTFTGSGFALGAAIKDARDTAVNISGALATRVGELNVAFTGASGVLRSSITTVESGYVNASGAIAERITTVNASFTGASGTLRAGITDVESSFVNGSGALADRITSVNASFTGASGLLRAGITGVETAFVNASGALAFRIDGVQAAVNGVSGSVETETSARVNAVSGLSGSVALNWGVKLNGDSGVIGAIKMVGQGDTSAFLVITDFFKVQTASKITPAGAGSSEVTLLSMSTNGIVFGADVASNNYAAGSAGWAIKRSSGDAEFNNITLRGQILGGTTVGTAGSSTYGLTLNNQYGIKRANSNGVLTISAGNGNGVQYGAQIDMVGAFFNTGNAAGGDGNGQLSLQAAYNGSNNFNAPSDGAVIIRTSRARTENSADIGIQRIMVTLDGTVLIGKGQETVDGSIGPNGGDGKLLVSKELSVGGNDLFNNLNDGIIYVKKAGGSGATTITLTGSSGNITATTFTTTSSKKVKSNIKKLKSGLTTVSKLNPVSFKRKGTKQQDIGLIAEEVNEIIPVIVKHNEKNEAEGLDYSKLTVILINAVKELSLEIEKLKNKIG